MAEYGLTDQGFLAKRYEDIVADLKQNIFDTFGINVDSNPDNAINIMINILALPQAQNWASVQALQSMMDIDQASGIFLDYLTASKLVFRQDGSNSSGVVSVYIDETDTLTLPIQSSFYNNNNNEFLTQQVLNLSTGNCHGVDIVVDSAYSGAISFTFAGETYTRSTITEGSIEAALQELAVDLIGDGHVAVAEGFELMITLSAVSGNTPKVNFVKIDGDFTYQVIGYVDVDYTEQGDFIFLANTLTVAPPFTAIDSYTNTIITGGRYRETDEELRQRFKESIAILGKATVRAIKSNLLNIDGVSEVLITENDSSSEVNGQPAHSIEAVVIGGDDTEVAETLYDVKGGGIQLHGNTTIIIKDVNNQDLGITFTRVANIFTWVNVEYVKYPEEEFPIDGETLIKDTVVSYVNSLAAGKDVIAGRIEANIYNNISGVEELNVTIFGSTDPNATPSYSDQPIRVADSQEAVTSVGRLTALEVT